MSIQQIADFSNLARTSPDVGEKLKGCIKMKEMFALARENGFDFDEDSLYPPNEPQFTEDQLSERLAKALLRV
ncbi:Nif11-like leader peptide family natural product precursor [Amphritea pacifica]|uniref:Nif11-like leader peptide family natural product n=1 Tax=Amphritea pacifica TaxID=2811233 RepID=A0ABS2W6A4_9GAMM|nr:Nif11-like leader peptide family natural product precursor [Amphritea pacifica]MBN0987243.1 Nif11-like leader peptide family natural product precursor [Amphritea pacifica]MBN1005733.1 Nif11-like leader peptide family natural product precursor [Amphritea pacifica]